MRSTKSCSLKFCFGTGVGPFCDASSDQLKINQIVCLYSPFYIGNWWLPAVNPPSMTKTAPVAKFASSDARNSAAFAMSMGFRYVPTDTIAWFRLRYADSVRSSVPRLRFARCQDRYSRYGYCLYRVQLP